MRQREDQVFLALTLVIGAVVGLAVVGMILLTERLGTRMFPSDGSPLRRLLVPALVSLVMGNLLWKFFPDARGGGLPQTKAALFARDGFISFRTVIGKFFCTSATLACGIPLGPEGPSVQIGAGICSVLGRKLGLSTEKVKALLPVGAAAAIAAAFNTPLAAVLFALEEIMGDMHAQVLGSAVMASATSWMVLRLVLGNEPLFHVPQYTLANPMEFGIYAVLGVVGGLISVAFVKMLLKMRERFRRMPVWSLRYQPAVAGLTVGVLAMFIPEVLGVGYGRIGQALNGQMALPLMAGLVLLKLVVVALCYSSGNAGGILGPTLFIGAMLGGLVGGVAHLLLPQYTAGPGAYALVGMGTAFAGIIRAPMVSVVMIFEITRDYAIIVPLMVSNLISFYISRRMQEMPIYEALARQDGIHLPSHESHKESSSRVLEVMRPVPSILSTNMSIPAAVDAIARSGFRSLPVTDGGGVVGVVSQNVLLRESYKADSLGSLDELRNARQFPHVHPDHSLHVTLERMGAAGVDILPVVSRANAREMLGVVALRDIMHSYKLDGEGHQRETNQS
jgi:CIC family chloride channel protein